MRVRTGIIAATTVTALWSLALPAHAGDTDLGPMPANSPDIVPTVTASECTSDGGMVMNGVCQGGTANGFFVVVG